MGAMQMLRGLEQVRWDEFPQPPWNATGAVPFALLALANTTGNNDLNSYNQLLYATGNNHAGTYFPIVLPTIPFLAQILKQAQLTARLQALEVLIDLVGSFGPERGFEYIATPQGQRPLRLLVKKAVLEQAAEIERCRADAESIEEARLAGEVLALLQT